MKLGGRHQPNAWVQARGAQFQPHQHAKTRQNKVRKPVPHGQIPIRSGHQMSFSFVSVRRTPWFPHRLEGVMIPGLSSTTRRHRYPVHLSGQAA